MAGTSSIKKDERMTKVKSILISQPKPERSPYFDLQEKYKLKIDFRPFIHVEPVTEPEFRKERIRPDAFNIVIFTSKGSIEHYFRMCEEMRIEVDPDMRYYCLTEAVANYLQKFINYRKRKVFVGTRKIEDLHNYFLKHRDKGKYLLPCSNLGANHVTKYLKEKNINYQEAVMFRTVSSDLSDLEDVKYDILVFFSPLGISSLLENFPDFKQEGTRIAVYGSKTLQAMDEHKLHTDIKAPIPEAPSMSMALERYIKVANGR